jgi:hypothetical protein
MTYTQISDFLHPTLENVTELYREVNESTTKTRQFIENTGIHYINEPNGIFITKATVSGKVNFTDVTNTMILVNGQIDCDQTQIKIDTNNLIGFTVEDIESGTTKIIEITYTTNHNIFEEVKIRHEIVNDELFLRTYDPVVCIGGTLQGHPNSLLIDKSPVYLIHNK